MSNTHPKDDIYIGINYGHDGAVTIVYRGEIVFYSEEERYDHKKSSFSFAHSLYKACHFVMQLRKEIQVKERKDPKIRFGVVAICTGISGITTEMRPSGMPTGIHGTHSIYDLFFPYLREIVCIDARFTHNSRIRWYCVEHHDAHAAIAFHRSGFDEALCITIDGGGGGYLRNGELMKESDTISYRKLNSVEYLERSGTRLYRNEGFPDKVRVPKERYTRELRSDCSYGVCFSRTSRILFGDSLGAGKLMGLSAYGRQDDAVDEIGNAFEGRRPVEQFYESSWAKFKSGEITAENLAYKIQKESGDAVIEYVKHALKYKPETKNVCCSGGFFYNIINNQKLIKAFPHINFYFEPMCGDVGVSTGCALREYYRLSNDENLRPIKTLYIGSEANYDRDLQDGEVEYKVSPSDVAQLIADRNVVAIYQGKAEAGPRALGNRSILYDPRDPNGRDRVNEIKKRQKFRPFAGSVMEEHAHEWFDMMNQKSSPYMMIAFDTLPEKKDLVPALQHNDGTSRIQTVNREQNPHYYDLINEFYKLTGVPMVLNTSFNLAGDTMVDNMQDALWTCRNGNIPYLYCPERKMIIDFTGRKNA